jgi:Mlc titration factor MtfA (ptsG expression regulator)
MLERNFQLYQQLPPADQQELLGHIQVFLAEKHFEGCGGLEITEEIRLTIAAQACLLLLHRKTDYYPRLTSILVYPSAYVARVVEHSDAGIVSEGFDERIGEAWSHGTVVLSWDDVRHGAADIHDGHNVVLHEFAHQLDEESGAAEGLPVLEQRSMYVAWARVLGDAYERLRRDVELHRPTVLDEYGATDAAEFFAVVTECFFEKPMQLKRAHPELYEELRKFYRQDPAAYLG